MKTFFAKGFNANEFKSDLDYKLLKDAFCKSEEEIKQEEEEKKKMASKANKVVYIIDQKRVGDIGIQMTNYSMSIKDTVKALLDLDDSVLDAEKILKLQKISPTSEEIEKLTNYKGLVNQLTNIEQFLL